LVRRRLRGGGGGGGGGFLRSGLPTALLFYGILPPFIASRFPAATRFHL